MSDQSPYFDELMVNRQVLLWAIATRQQLERWEALVAARVRSGFDDSLPFSDADIWRAQIEHHFLLIAARQLLRAIEMLDQPFDLPPVVAAELIEGRDLHEHWAENLEIFNTTPRPAVPKYRSGKAFAKRNPDKGPYWWLGWSSSDGPTVLPNVAASDLHDLADRAIERVLVNRPDLARFVPSRVTSPWLGGEFGSDQWWPRPEEETDGGVAP